ncbi:MAG TPA: hypothetical protein VLE19_12580 [Pyrinomonadaceae bacterium]|nr:hypothetical protein [Pyrinomonadaceae bacterium]
MNIHRRSTRIIISCLVCITVVLLIWPHLMDVEPPAIVRILLKPAELLGYAIRAARGPCNNMGTPEHPMCEGTPVDLLFGLMVVALNILLYPALTYLSLWFLSSFRSKTKDADSKIRC